MSSASPCSTTTFKPSTLEEALKTSVPTTEVENVALCARSTQLLWWRTPHNLTILSVPSDMQFAPATKSDNEQVNLLTMRIASNPREWPQKPGLWLLDAWRPEDTWFSQSWRRVTIKELAAIHDGTWTPQDFCTIHPSELKLFKSSHAPR